MSDKSKKENRRIPMSTMMPHGNIILECWDFIPAYLSWWAYSVSSKSWSYGLIQDRGLEACLSLEWLHGDSIRAVFSSEEENKRSISFRQYINDCVRFGDLNADTGELR